MIWPYYWQSVRASVAGTGGPGGGGLLVYETFTGADGTALTDHTPDISPGGISWSGVEGMLLGTWQIQGNRAKLTATAGDHQNAVVINASRADATIEVDVILTGDADARIAFNFTDLDNHWIFTINDTGTSYLYERSAGTYTERDSYAIAGTPGTYRLKIVTNGDSVLGYVDGVEKVSYSVADRPHKAATHHGLSQFGSYDTTSVFDNFTVS